MGLGLAALGRPGYINLGHAEDLQSNYDPNIMRQKTHEVLDLAYANGIRYFDAAQSYGKSEVFLMSWIKNKKQFDKDFVVGSKWGYTYTANWQVQAEKHEVKEHSLKILNRQWEFTQNLLPHLKVYQVHSATFDSGILENKEVLLRLIELKHQGLQIGLSLSGTQQAEVLKAAMELSFSGRRLFDTVQVTYNILEQSTNSILKEAAHSGMGIIIKEGVANGRLTSRNNATSFQASKLVLEKIANKHEVTIDAIALAFILAQPWCHIVLSGAATKKHLLSNLNAFKVKLDEEDLENLQSLKMNKEDYWKERSQLKWN